MEKPEGTMLQIRSYFNRLKGRPLSRFEALYDLMSFKEVYGQNEFKTTTKELGRRWNWKHHNRVIRFINYLAESRLITKHSDHSGLYIKIDNVQ